ncbi:hypothetical protein [Halosegnis marinus]|uniref:hypothetical protein n=1 Tax=Halosegnis marinus TaxID=3034023 RepID=UPI0036143FD3
MERRVAVGTRRLGEQADIDRLAAGGAVRLAEAAGDGDPPELLQPGVVAVVVARGALDADDRGGDLPDAALHALDGLAVPLHLGFEPLHIGLEVREGGCEPGDLVLQRVEPVEFGVAVVGGRLPVRLLLDLDDAVAHVVDLLVEVRLQRIDARGELVDAADLLVRRQREPRRFEQALEQLFAAEPLFRRLLRQPRVEVGRQVHGQRLPSDCSVAIMHYLPTEIL